MNRSCIILGMRPPARRMEKLTFWLLMGILLLSSCQISKPQGQIQPSDTPANLIPTASPTTKVTNTNSPVQIKVYIDPQLPEDFQGKLSLFSGVKRVNSPGEAQTEITFEGASSPLNWVYVLVAPFPTVMDGVSFSGLQKSWQGDLSGVINRSILLSKETRDVFAHLWGEPQEIGIQVVDPGQIQNLAWKTKPSWAIIPFEDLDPKWKVLTVDGMSPLDKDFSPEQYPLVLNIKYVGEDVSWGLGISSISNYNPALL